MKLEIETFSIFMIFLKCSSKEFINRFFRNKSLQCRRITRNLSGQGRTKHKNERPNSEKFRFFLQEKLRNCILNENLTHRRPKSGHLSSNFQEGAGETSPSRPSSYALVVIRKYRISLLTKFAIVKLKIDLFSVSRIFLKSALRWKLSVACFVERSLHPP